MKSSEQTMEKVIEELTFQIPFKDETEPGDLLLILREGEDRRIAMVYARVMGFDRDTAKRDEWWHVHFLFLEMPPATRTIILQTPHFTGKEIFTMGGRKVFMKALNEKTYYDEMRGFHEPEVEEESEQAPASEKEKKPKGSGGKPNFTLIK